MIKWFRKLIRWGSSQTLIISLPRKWVQLNSLSESDEIQAVLRPDNSLLIVPTTRETRADSIGVEIKVKDETDFDAIRWRLYAEYLDGADKITLTSKTSFSPDFPTKVRNFLTILLGLEIVQVNHASLVLSDMMNLQEQNFEELVRMISDQTLQFFMSILGTLKSNDFESLPAILPMRESIQKYYNRIHRELRKNLIHPNILTKVTLKSRDIIDFVMYIVYVNEVSDNLDRVARYVQEKGFPSPTEFVIQFTGEVIDFFRKSVDAFLFKEEKDAIQILRNHQAMLNKKREIENTIDLLAAEKNTVPLQITLDIMEKIVDSTRNIARCALRRIG